MTGDIIDVLLPNAGIVQTQVALPNAPALVAQTFLHYVVPFEIDLAMSITAITSSNALSCRSGRFDSAIHHAPTTCHDPRARQVASAHLS
jgi:hypothetical protein